MSQQTENIIFVVGNSRSGTSLMMRLLNRSPKVHFLNELHFFEKLWSVKDKHRPIDQKEALSLASRLLFIDRYNVLKSFQYEEFAAEAQELVAGLDREQIYRQDIYRAVLLRRTLEQGKEIPGEKTPQNLFYLREILEMFPQAKVINMVRDPRAVLLSQKRKWRRKYDVDSYIKDHRKEVWRLRMNYHPITISRLWVSAMKAAEAFNEHPQVMNVRFEEVTSDPQTTLARICNFAEIEYQPSMLDVEYNGSSTDINRGQKRYGIQQKANDSWKKGLSKAEIFICQWICGKYFDAFQYERIKVGLNPFALLFHIASFPVKLTGALLMNLHRMRNIGEAIRRRLAS
ncbi:MAG: sulfotransferase [Bacteroidota bacterium]